MSLRLACLVLVLAVFAAGCSSSTPGATQPSQPLASPTVDGSGSAASETLSQASVSNGNGQGGGQVRDVAPTFPVFTLATPSVDNSGGNVLAISGTISDANGEQDLQFLYVKGTTYSASAGFQYLGANHTIAGTERNQSSEPASAGSDGYKVWDCGGRDGVLCWKYLLTVPQFTQAGTYTFNATAGKASSFASSLPSQMLTATVASFSQLDFSPFPVDASGVVQTGANWGQWVANPGDANVTSTNYLKLINNGDVPTARVQISFSGTAFTGTTDPSWTVPFERNVQFQYCDAVAGTAPSACTFGAWTAPNSGAATVQFAGKGHVIYVAYRVVALPSPLMAQSYGATFTATEL